jgi:hypothetical protein
MACVLIPFVQQPAPLALADRLALIIEGLCQAIAGRGGRLGSFAGPLIILIWTRLRRIAARFTRAAATLPPVGRPARRRTRSPRLRQPSPLPRRKAWLLRLVPETASAAAQLRHFLTDPEVAALLADAPHLNRILRPLCHALGIRFAQAPCPPTSPRHDAAPSPRAIPSHAPPQAAPAAFPPWPVPPRSPCTAPDALA